MEMLEIRVTPCVERFFNEKDYFGIYVCYIHREDLEMLEQKGWGTSNHGTISFKGIAPRLDMGQEYFATISLDIKSTYKGSFILERIRQEKPITVEEQRNFLHSILSEAQSSKVLEFYNNGEDIIGMIQEGSFDYQSISGLGEKTYEKLRTKVLDNLELSEVLVFLDRHGIKYNMISKLVKEYKNPQIVIQKIEENPYLLTEVKGIGFAKADSIAKAIGHDMTSHLRITSCIRYVIGEENTKGHSWLNHKQLLNRCIELLNINKSYIEEVLNNGSKGVKRVDTRYTRQEIFEAEENISLKMTRFKTQSKKIFESEYIDEFLDKYCEKHGLELEEKQREFFHNWNNHNILLLIGGGGMGKSYLQRILLELIKEKNLTTALLAPTGKSAKVVTNYTKQQASTIHRKIGVFDDEEEAFGRIYEDIILVDESSMCDALILSKLFNAIENFNAKILFVGDDFQLSSVGVGNFLYDAIQSDVIKICQLQKVFRQAEGGILNVATDIREGKKFLNDNADGRIVFGKDCVFHLCEQEYIQSGYLFYYEKMLKTFDPEDIVILSPTKKGTLGVEQINKEIQKIVNPRTANKKEKTFGRDKPVTFRVGDAVMNTINSYKVETVDGGFADVFNGDTGKIIDIEEKEKVIVVDFEGIVVKMKFETILASLLHSWAMTIHKSQGSQFKVVIVIADKSASYQLNANLLYTAISRAKNYLLVLSQAETINKSIVKFENMARRSFLQELLKEYNKAS